ncbi:hypothetical protein A8709_18390 [Paenibacillus pectinilyticus]|uniref:Uncharacterized protein n=1 Tax=Paenibacillus pectinilyticus TaxID=512399 RepID=A0A1C0ZZJ9_9BACL|nr:hypothetical protein [Paenibacillus pectinilyticus]OCT13563.1 hypothetical protein A8709_18390 [Paenibacillus pectinilyticus]
MSFLKTKLILILACSSLMVPSVISAATETPATPSYMYLNGSIHTNVHGIYIPGRYLVDEDTVAVYIPGGIGILAVDKHTVLPEGTIFLNSYTP